MKQKQLARELQALSKAPALATAAEIKAMFEQLAEVGKGNASAHFARLPGASLIAALHADRGLAVEAARTVNRGREIAKLYRQLANLFDAGSKRVDVCLRAHPDGAAILAEAETTSHVATDAGNATGNVN